MDFTASGKVEDSHLIPFYIKKFDVLNSIQKYKSSKKFEQKVIKNSQTPSYLDLNPAENK
mgnify:CR=1 FL=1